MSYKKIHIIIQIIFVFGFSSFKISNIEENKITGIRTISESKAGSSIDLVFSSSKKNIKLFCTNSYSTAVLEPIEENNELHFIIPEHITNKKGLIQWKVIHNNKALLSGKITVRPSDKKIIMESYAGPPSIVAGGVDYFMLTVCPADEFDNPLPEETDVIINHQFQSRIVSSTEKIKRLVAWKTIFSYDKSGRFLVNSECKGVPSKEITTEVYPNNAVDFKISASRFHDYADGNQIASFKTSIIKDAYGNIVSDGTHVIFITRNSKGKLLTTYGNTIAGIATGKMLHPDQEESWKTHAYIDGIAESDTLNISFKQLFKDFSINFSETNRKIKIGPIKSFMDQLIPDGFITQLRISKNDSLIDTKEIPTRKGYAKFYLHPDFYINDTYKLEVKTGGVKKSFIKELKE
ncbi:hypothetical protein [uncultured Tenacibaculum sp.]|uniref:hypothetical protein n=1 Tax=uncultured Tenacibaculum sp. TaxID=174713 RepID=UPI0026103C44|nr:hypothetical protein [uncultured Tenacibaculum sp.]